MVALPYEDGSGWYVEARWIGRATEQLGRFNTYAEARDWIALEFEHLLCTSGAAIRKPAPARTTVRRPASERLGCHCAIAIGTVLRRSDINHGMDHVRGGHRCHLPVATAGPYAFLSKCIRPADVSSFVRIIESA